MNLGVLNLSRDQTKEDTISRLRLVSLDAQTRQDFAQNKADTIQKTKEAGERSKVEAENLKQLKQVTELKRDELKDIYKVYKDLAAEVEEIKKM